MTASQELQDSFDESLKLSSQGQTSCTLKRQLRSHSTATRSFPAKRLCGGALSTEVVEAEANLLTKPSGFLTAGSSREIGVSEKALSLARARFRSPVDATEDGSVKRDVPSTFPGFVTAGSNKIITVTEAALEAARRRLNSIEDVEESNINRRKTDEENLDPTVHSSSVGDSSLKRTLAATTAPITRNSSRNRFNSPFRPPDMVKPNPPRTPTSFAGVSEVPHICAASSRITCVRDLRNIRSYSTDFLGIITEDKIYDVSHADHPLILKVADRYGEFIPLEMPSSSVPSGLSRGSVVSVEGALIKRWQGTISLVVTDSTFVDLEPHDPEADCLRRLFSTGLFDLPITEETFSFTSTTLRLIARLDEYSWEPSTVMARISSINPDNLVYLGCTACKVLVSPTQKGLVSCQQCQNSKARYFYSLIAELVDFSGAVTVSLTDDAAKKLMGQPAGAMLKLTNEQLRSKLSKLLFRPMLFRLSLQDSKWLVEDWKYLDIPRFKPYLRGIAEQKGYK